MRSQTRSREMVGIERLHTACPSSRIAAMCAFARLTLAAGAIDNRGGAPALDTEQWWHGRKGGTRSTMPTATPYVRNSASKIEVPVVKYYE